MNPLQRFNDRRAAPADTICLLLLVITTAAYCLWVLMLPLFPTQDGPMHLYYAHVLQALLQKTPSVYEHYYSIKHLLPPYSLYYYTLIVLMKMAPALLADKLVICLYLILFSFGFRYLAIGIGPGGHLMSLLGSLLLLNWALGMGFVNYCLSIALAMWAIGFWLRALGRPEHKRKIIFLLLVYATMMSHPVPLLFILGFGFIDLGIRFVRSRGHGDEGTSDRSGAYLLQDAVYLLLASGTVLYVKLFTVANVFRREEMLKLSVHSFSDNAFYYLHLLSLDIFHGDGAVVILHRLCLYLILLLPLILAAQRLLHHMKSGTWTSGDTWLVLSVLMIVLLPAIPNEINHSYLFAARLVLFIWLAGIAAGSLYRVSSPLLLIVIMAFSILGNGLVLVMAHDRISPVADRLAPINDLRAGRAGEVGLVLFEKDYVKLRTVSYDPYMWAAAHYFRVNDAVFYNSPWLREPIIPLGPLPASLTLKTREDTLSGYQTLRKDMTASTEVRDEILSGVDFVIIDRAAGPKKDGIDPLLVNDAKSSTSWVCDSYSWFDLCNKTSTSRSR